MANTIKTFKNNNKLKATEVYYDSNTSILDAIFPIGRGFIDFTNTDFSDYLGFTWERELVGLTPVGLDVNDTDFNVIGKTGGSKYLQKHKHSLYWGITQGGSGNAIMMGADKRGIADEQIVEDGTGEAGNLQPYKVVAYWKRVA